MTPLAERTCFSQALILIFVGPLAFFTAVLCMPPVLCGLDGYWFVLAITCVFSFTGGNTATFSTSMSVIADVTDGWTDRARTNVFIMLEAALWGGGILGPVIGGKLGKLLGLRQSFLFAVVGIGVAIVLLLLCFQETLKERRPIKFTVRALRGG